MQMRAQAIAITYHPHKIKAGLRERLPRRYNSLTLRGRTYGVWSKSEVKRHMAAVKKIYTKEELVKKEIRRLKSIFKDLDDGKRKLVTPLIEKAAFMSVELDYLQEAIKEKGWTSEYKNGNNQYGTKKSPEAETYISLSKNYTTVVKQLTDLVPEQKRKASKLAAFRNE